MSQQASDQASGSPQASRPGRQQPLFIVSEQGRHTEESRRIVRAQAARASAAQSRVTRARNREEREGTVRSPTSDDLPSHSGFASPAHTVQAGLQHAAGPMPLTAWLPCIVGGATGAVVRQAREGTTHLASSIIGASTRLASGELPSFTPSVPKFGLGFNASTSEPPQSPGEGGKFLLPLALPRGFTRLQQQIALSPVMIDLLSRTACIDFASPGVEQRLHQLLFDLITNAAGTAIGILPGHPIQGHLRVACTCLTIFQGQRADGQLFAQDHKYQLGLEAAWSQATLLDPTALDEPKSAEASLWAVFMITVTTGATATYFHPQLHGIMQYLQLRAWEQVRKVLLDFIYPVSFLDEPCRSFYHSLQPSQMGVPAAAG